MSLATKPITVRLSPEHLQRFGRLTAEFPGLPASAVLRFLIAAQLERPLAEQVALVEQQIRSPKGPGAGGR